jgi:membrane protein implicated in regulation of membrane protease activity
VTESVHPQAPGVVKVKGENWRAVSKTDHFEKDQIVEIVKIEGASVIIRRTS